MIQHERAGSSSSFVFDPGHAYAYQCSAYSTAIFLFGGLIDYSTKKGREHGVHQPHRHGEHRHHRGHDPRISSLRVATGRTERARVGDAPLVPEAGGVS